MKSFIVFLLSLLLVLVGSGYLAFNKHQRILNRHDQVLRAISDLKSTLNNKPLPLRCQST